MAQKDCEFVIRRNMHFVLFFLFTVVRQSRVLLLEKELENEDGDDVDQTTGKCWCSVHVEVESVKEVNTGVAQRSEEKLKTCNFEFMGI
jgi:hypothetical protein